MSTVDFFNRTVNGVPMDFRAFHGGVHRDQRIAELRAKAEASKEPRQNAGFFAAVDRPVTK